MSLNSVPMVQAPIRTTRIMCVPMVSPPLPLHTPLNKGSDITSPTLVIADSTVIFAVPQMPCRRIANGPAPRYAVKLAAVASAEAISSSLTSIHTLTPRGRNHVTKETAPCAAMAPRQSINASGLHARSLHPLRTSRVAPVVAPI